MDKDRALEMALTQIEKQFGKGSVMRLGEAAKNNAVEAIPTGSLALDLALGINGIPKGRITEIYGAESSGKTTVAAQIVGNIVHDPAEAVDRVHRLPLRPGQHAHTGVEGGALGGAGSAGHGGHVGHRPNIRPIAAPSASLIASPFR